jgi:antibiotic biosynthesis monooxygenase (ABM) superfamily enzyme
MKIKFKVIASLKIWAAIYPSITLFLYLFAQPLAPLPLYVRTLVLTVTLVPWIVFVGVPLIDVLIRQISIKSSKIVK